LIQVPREIRPLRLPEIRCGSDRQGDYPESNWETIRKMIVYVALLDEGTPCWRTAEADHVRDDIYKLRGPIPEDEVWEFQPGDAIRRAIRKTSTGDEIFAAVSRAD
jgi:hypothetical protein